MKRTKFSWILNSQIPNFTNCVSRDQTFKTRFLASRLMPNNLCLLWSFLPWHKFIYFEKFPPTRFLRNKYQNIPTHTKIYKFINICMRKPPTSKYFKYIFFQMSILRQVVKNQVKIVHWRHPVEFWYPQTSQTDMNYEQFEHKQSLISVHCLKKVVTFK